MVEAAKFLGFVKFWNEARYYLCQFIRVNISLEMLVVVNTPVFNRACFIDCDKGGVMLYFQFDNTWKLFQITSKTRKVCLFKNLQIKKSACRLKSFSTRFLVYSINKPNRECCVISIGH